MNLDKIKSYFREESKGLVHIILLILIVRSSFYEPYKIPSGSMIPTLLIGDYILVEKFSYSLKLPFSDMFENPISLTQKKIPARGDVIVFKYPLDTNINYIKRVIGLPNDRISVINNSVYINDVAIETHEIDGTEIMKDMDEKFKTGLFQFFETKTGDHTHITQIDQGEQGQSLANIGEIRVPEGHLFVMGDNRNYSSDSRVWGFVPLANVKGRARFIWFSANMPCPAFLNFLCGDNDDSTTFRPHRIGTVIN